jgi:hypothetical protein
MRIPTELLESTCKNAIETILTCLENATKGTIYSIDPMPSLQAVRITSGKRNPQTCEITWGLPEASDYNPPGKSWQEYRDRPGRALEAMGWCVERQKSWTADNPFEDTRSVRRQLYGEIEDYYHLEPVLVKKKDFYGDRSANLEYARNWEGYPIWQNSDYVVVAAIKIHFEPNTIKRGDRSTQVIKQLARTFGTELLSLHLREHYLEAQQELSRQRLQSVNLMAHELRNTLTKLGFVFSAANAMMSFLREQWEAELRKVFPFLEDKTAVLAALNQLLKLRQPLLDDLPELGQLSHSLEADQQELMDLFLLPEQAEKWLQDRIRMKWRRLMLESSAWEEDSEEVEDLLERLEHALWVPLEPELAERMEHLPEDLRTLWPKIAYSQFSAGNLDLLDETLQLLEHRELRIRHRQQLKKALNSLKILVETIASIEAQANRMLSSLKNGGVPG